MGWPMIILLLGTHLVSDSKAEISAVKILKLSDFHLKDKWFFRRCQPIWRFGNIPLPQLSGPEIL